ncbi:MAG: hypothetical protein D6690_10380 [Nitrospirae bacterium]|nr:MAG: hypothetical protein D6690_10380 [Nitrospirota bacterium]
MAITISNVPPTFSSSHSVPSVFREHEIASLQRAASHDESASTDKSNLAVSEQVDRVELSQEARQQAQTKQVSSANPGAHRQDTSPFDTE